MKYIVFAIAVLSMFPMVLLLGSRSIRLRWAILAMILPVLAFNETAINFFSHEFYRGTSRGLEISIIYILAATILITLFLWGKITTLLPDWGSRIYLMYFLSCVPSLYTAHSQLFSIFELWKMIMLYLVFLAVYYYLKYSIGDFDIFIYALVIVVAVNFIAIITQHFSGFYQVKGMFPHQNSLGMYMSLTGMIFFARFFNRREQISSWIFFATFCMASMMLVRTYSRGSIACYPLAGLVTLLCSVRYSVSLRKINILLVIAMIALAGMAVVLPRLIDRFQNAPESSGQTRINLAIAAMNMIRDQPVIGVGINNWGIKINPPYDYSRHREDSNRYTEEFKDGIVETIYLLVGAECGIPSLLLLLTWFGYYWFSAFRLLKTLRGTPYYYIPAGTLGGMTAVFLQSTLEWVLKQQVNFMLLFIVFAFISYLNRHSRQLIAELEKRKEAKARS